MPPAKRGRLPSSTSPASAAAAATAGSKKNSALTPSCSSSHSELKPS